MSSELLGMLSEFILAFFYFTDKRKKRMIVFLFVEFLVEEWNYISTGLFFNLNDDIEHFFFLSRAKGNFD